MGPYFETGFQGFRAKAARGEGGQESTCSKSDEKAVFSAGFQDAALSEIQGARSRGLGGK